MLFKRGVRQIVMGHHFSIFQTSQPALFVATDVKGKAPVSNKLHDYSYHVLVIQESEQLAVETTVLGSVISPRQIHKHGTDLSVCLKTDLHALSQQNFLISHAEIQPAQQGALDR